MQSYLRRMLQAALLIMSELNLTLQQSVGEG